MFSALALGYYIFVSATATSSSSNAIISLPATGPALGPQCAVVFWYHMNGASNGILRVLRGTTSTASSRLWTKTGGQGNRWNRGVVQLGSSTSLTSTFTVW